MTECKSCGEPTPYQFQLATDGPREGLMVATCNECGGEWE